MKKNNQPLSMTFKDFASQVAGAIGDEPGLAAVSNKPAGPLPVAPTSGTP